MSESGKIEQPRILVYQDNGCDIIAEHLAAYGFNVTASDNSDIVAKLEAENYDICVLDFYNSSFPCDLRLLTNVRNRSDKIPVIFVSGSPYYGDLVKAFNEGVDDYVTRPYCLDELACRIKALLRRANIKSRFVKDLYEIGKYRFDIKEGILSVGSKIIKLRPREIQILGILCAYEGEVVSKRIIAESIWDDKPYSKYTNIDWYVSRIREHLKADPNVSIETITKVGYIFRIKKG